MNRLRSRIGTNFAFLAVVSLLLLLFQAQFPTVQATVRNVPGVYPTIQQAVDAADPGDTIEVSAGVYPENVFVDKSLTFEGQDKYNTVVDGNGTGHAFWLMQSDVIISGFTIKNGNYCGIKADMFGGHLITDNIFSNNPYGVYLFQTPSGSDVVSNTFHSNSMFGIKLSGSSNNNISNNYISDSTYGVKLDAASEYNSITGNTISGASHGINVGYSSNNDIDQNDVSSEITGIYSLYSDYTNIRNNTLSECAYGIELYGATNNVVLGNTMAQNGYGIYLVYASSNMIDSNLASNNDWGIATYDSDSNNIIQNTASYNTYGIDINSYSTGNTIALNNIIKNDMQRHQDSTSGANTWYKLISAKEYGNYWSNYLGEDTNGDGIGDTLRPHEGVDYYPLMQPWTIVHDVAILSVASSNDTVYQGQVVNITVVVRNEGTVSETFDVTAKYFNLVIETKTVTNLARYESTTLVFSWNTTDVPTGFDYEIRAEASIVAGETDTNDNTFIDGTVTVVDVHDVAVRNVTPSRTLAYAGYGDVYIEVEVENEGTLSETFDVTAYYNSTIIETQTVTLASRANIILVFTWNTSDVAPSYYVISATAEPVPDETDHSDNSLTDGTINIKIPGDVNGDGIVDIVDWSLLSAYWYPGPPIGPLGYDINADINNDGAVNIVDMSIVSAHWDA